jgi:PIN domain nuclease of toxin-antitoxin system
VNGYLLDTNVALIAVDNPEKLRQPVKRAIVSGPNVISSVSYWEVVLKSMKGLLHVGDPRAWWRDTLDQLAATSLPLRPEHVSELYNMPTYHKDPFDRILVAQASVEELALVTTDTEIPRYKSARFRVVT